MVGHIDQIALDCVDGWAADTEAPDSVKDVVIYLNGKRAVRITCDRLRTDLRDLGEYGKGLHGFRWEVSQLSIPIELSSEMPIEFSSLR